MRRVADYFLVWEWLILLILLPLLLFFPERSWFLLAVIPGLWLVRWLATGRFWPPTPYNLALLLLLLMAGVSLVVTTDFSFSLPKLAGLLVSAALFLGAVAYTRRFVDGVWHLLGFLLLAGSGMALAGLLASPLTGQLPLPAAARFTMPGAVDGFVNPNQLAGVTAPLVALFWAAVAGLAGTLWRSVRAGRLMWLMWLVLVGGTIVMTAALVLSGSRGGLLSAAVALLVMLAVRFRWGRWLLILALLALIITLAAFWQLDIEALVLGSASGTTLNLQSRMEIWSRALYAIEDFPLTGLGMNSFRRLVHVLYPMFTVAPTFDLAHAHNHLLQTGVDLGLPGLIAYLSLWLVSAGLLWQNLRARPAANDRVLLVGLAGAFSAAWTFGILDAVALGARGGFLWWLLLALLVAVADNVRVHARGVRRQHISGTLPDVEPEPRTAAT